ncbi:GNAT family N-acetyltransferase [Lacrimispora sp. JR3]|uniref:GNAT family N-acetyltransferase n=1 Tax=Lacrimispora sinapis TaxID=3111456 RepID=UPI0037481B5F
MIVYRKVRQDELDQAAELLTKSFEDYSFFNMYAGNNIKKRDFVHAIQEANLKTAYKKYTVIAGAKDNQMVSLAQLKPPHKSEAGFFDYLLGGGIKIILTGGLKNAMELLKMNEEATAVCHDQTGRVWYLSTLAVSTAHQGQGLGSKMLHDCIIPYIEKRGGGLLTLITNTEKNREFYKKNGFEEFHSMTIRRNGKELGNWSYRMNIEKK